MGKGLGVKGMIVSCFTICKLSFLGIDPTEQTCYNRNELNTGLVSKEITARRKRGPAPMKIGDAFCVVGGFLFCPKTAMNNLLTRTDIRGKLPLQINSHRETSGNLTSYRNSGLMGCRFLCSVTKES